MAIYYYKELLVDDYLNLLMAAKCWGQAASSATKPPTPQSQKLTCFMLDSKEVLTFLCVHSVVLNALDSYRTLCMEDVRGDWEFVRWLDVLIGILL